MNLVFNHVVKFDHMHNTNRSLFIKWFTSETIKELNTTVMVNTSLSEFLRDNFIWNTVEGWGCNLVTKNASSHTDVDFKELTEVHTRRHTHWGKYDVDWGTVGHKWHIFNWKDARNHTLVTVTTSHLVTDLNFTHFGNKDFNLHQDTGLKFVTLLTGVDTDTDNLTGGTTSHAN